MSDKQQRILRGRLDGKVEQKDAPSLEHHKCLCLLRQSTGGHLIPDQVLVHALGVCSDVQLRQIVGVQTL